MLRTAKEQKLDSRVYQEAEAWEKAENALYEAKSALNVSSFAYAGTLDVFDEEGGEKQVARMKEMLEEKRDAVEMFAVALIAFKKAVANKYYESHHRVLSEYIKEIS